MYEAFVSLLDTNQCALFQCAFQCVLFQCVLFQCALFQCALFQCALFQCTLLLHERIQLPQCLLNLRAHLPATQISFHVSGDKAAQPRRDVRLLQPGASRAGGIPVSKMFYSQVSTDQNTLVH